MLQDDDATISVVSVASGATTRVSDMYSQMRALQTQVNLLQASSLPTYNNPWEVEVIFLPFRLEGIWLPSANSPPSSRAFAPVVAAAVATGRSSQTRSAADARSRIAAL